MPILPDKIEGEGHYKKQWTFIGVYELRELRDVFLVIREYKNLPKAEVYQKIRELVKKENLDKSWQSKDTRERDILEYQNALENLNLIDYDKRTKLFIIKNYVAFAKSFINQPLSEQDNNDFKNLFLGYIRFKEALSWFATNKTLNTKGLENIINNVDYEYLSNNSIPLYTFNRNGNKSIDSVIYELKNDATIYTIDDSSKNFIRFWDVFTTIGEKLGIINSFSFPIEVYVKNDKTLNYNYRKIRYNYVVNDKIHFDIAKYLENTHHKENTIRIPDLIKELVMQFHYPIDAIKDEIVEQCRNDYKNLFSLQRTSFAFIENSELKFFPLVNNYYMSHILLRK